MKIFKIAISVICILCLGSCAVKLPLNKQFYESKKVGIIIDVDSIGLAKAGAQGLLDMALTPGDKYTKPLQTIEPQVNPFSLLKNEISDILKSRNKDFILIDINLKDENFSKFDTPDTDKKYYKKDIRALKSKYNVDEILYAEVKYGILVSYYSMIEIDRQGYMNISTSIIDLQDNSLLLSDRISSVAPIKGNWKKEPEYLNLKTSIQNAIDKTITTWKTKF
ncbi:hypothetical protein [Pedobacter glucosidilyticus]|uniref:hypothetical protein n=1 Tax=Pedobacter glucosidilyticus TaxID=1122941 RepID=UPI000427A1A1|nr:hypothetical protein [Pedobacter glucosidilyticus]